MVLVLVLVLVRAVVTGVRGDKVVRVCDNGLEGWWMEESISYS